jgi:hypothetical protein
VSRRTQENLAALLILAVLIGVIYLSFDYGPRARMVPLPVAILGVILVVIQLVWQNVRARNDLQVDLLRVITKQGENEIAPAPAAGGEEAVVPTRGREAKAFAMVAIFLALVLLAGPIPAAALFTFGYFVMSGHYRWGKAAIYTALFTGAIYLLFVVALDVQLYHGVLESLVHR